MKMGWKKILPIGITLLLLLAVGTLLYKLPDMGHVDATEPTRVYSVLPGDPEWEQLGSVEDKIRACAIDEEILRNLTDEELVQAILDYPFIIDLWLVDDYRIGVQSVCKNSDAFRELLSRDNAKDILMNWLKGKSVFDLQSVSAEGEMQIGQIALLLMYTDQLAETVTKEDVEILNGFSSVLPISLEWEEKTSSGSAQLTISSRTGLVVSYEIDDE